MSPRIVDRYGVPLPTVGLRRRIGFLGGDLIAEQDTCTNVTPPDNREVRNILREETAAKGPA